MGNRRCVPGSDLYKHTQLALKHYKKDGGTVSVKNKKMRVCDKKACCEGGESLFTIFYVSITTLGIKK